MLKFYRGYMRGEQPNRVNIYGYRDRMAYVNATYSGYDVYVERDGMPDDELGGWIWFGTHDSMREAVKDAGHILRRIAWFERGKPRKW